MMQVCHQLVCRYYNMVYSSVKIRARKYHVKGFYTSIAQHSNLITPLPNGNATIKLPTKDSDPANSSLTIACCGTFLMCPQNP